MTIAVEPYGPVFGAVVTGMDIVQGVSAEDFETLKGAFHEYTLLVLHDQPVDDDQQISFSSRFGPLQGPTANVTDRTTYLSRQSNIDMRSGELIADDDRRMLYKKANMLWHSDATYRQTLSLCSILSARIVPPMGGDTEFASTRAAYEELSRSEQESLEDLVVEHHLLHSRRFVGFTFTDEEAKSVPPVHHKLVQTDRITGRKSLLLGAHASHIVGWPVEEGRALLKELQERATKIENSIQFKWKDGDLIIWDNRACLHRATPFDAVNHRRLMQRATVSYIEAALS